MSHAAPDFVVISAFRYALGRMTYIVEEMAVWLEENWFDFPENARDLVHKELQNAFDVDAALDKGKTSPLGMDMDKVVWRRLLDKINEYEAE